MFVNNVKQESEEEIAGYITGFIEKSQANSQIDHTKVFISSVKNNLILALSLWFAGLTVVRSACGVCNCMFSRLFTGI